MIEDFFIKGEKDISRQRTQVSLLMYLHVVNGYERFFELLRKFLRMTEADAQRADHPWTRRARYCIHILHCQLSPLQGRVHHILKEKRISSLTSGLIHTGRATRRDAHANWNIFPLILLGCSVNTPIDDNRSHLLVLHCTSRPASCVN